MFQNNVFFKTGTKDFCVFLSYNVTDDDVVLYCVKQLPCNSFVKFIELNMPKLYLYNNQLIFLQNK